MKVVKCHYCGKQFRAKSWLVRHNWGKYCSLDCKNKSQLNGKYLKCSYCGKRIYRTPAETRHSKDLRFFCDKSCHCAWKNKHIRSLENAPNWNGGESIYRNVLLKSKIRQVCSRCGINDKRILVAHHKNRDRKDNEVKNLGWLCHNCHHIIHHCPKT